MARVELNMDGFTALRRSAQSQAVVSAAAADLAARANGIAQTVNVHAKGGHQPVQPHYHAFHAVPTAVGCVALVSTGDLTTNGIVGVATQIDNAKRDTLRRAL